MQLTLLNGYPDLIGKRFAFCGSGTGPSSYVQKASGGDPLSVPRFQNYIDVAFPSLSLSGTYVVYPYPSAVQERATWSLMWVTRSTGAEVASSTDLSAESVQLGGFGGVY
jgi:hypothetical protein